MAVPYEVILAIFLWVFLSILTKIYLIKKFGLSTLLSCLLLAIIFVGSLMIIGSILSFLKLEIAMLAFILAVWILFIAARGLLVTEKKTTRENVLFGALTLTYVALYIFDLLVALVLG